MTTYNYTQVTLILKTKDEYANPDKWDWDTLLDLNNNEDVWVDDIQWMDSEDWIMANHLINHEEKREVGVLIVGCAECAELRKQLQEDAEEN